MMLSRLLRIWSPDLLRPIIRLLMRARITPNQLTLAGLVLAIFAGVLAAIGSLSLAALVLLLSGFLDALDGELARQSDSQTPFGAFLDSISDHYGDFAVYLGIAWQMQRSGEHATVLLTLVAMFGSLVGSQIRSRAGMMGLDTKDVGIFTRAERIIVFVLGLLTGFLMPAIALLAFANNLSALQRLRHIAFNATKSAHAQS
ncbi:MAG: CDP-alcohol phosphatidyltransferase family protein [Betaproteobacteria bacterium]|nr:MAG: CDP-alcohol phosphatidyltransferase family protein [Betaproteobacteria bacterium]